MPEDNSTIVLQQNDICYLFIKGEWLIITDKNNKVVFDQIGDVELNEKVSIIQIKQLLNLLMGEPRLELWYWVIDFIRECLEEASSTEEAQTLIDRKLKLTRAFS